MRVGASCFAPKIVSPDGKPFTDYHGVTITPHGAMRDFPAPDIIIIPEVILEPTVDILAAMGARKSGQFLVGFAAETERLVEQAAAKLAAKRVDLMVANDVAEAGSGFGTDTNKVTVIEPNGPTEAWPQMSKRQVADRLLDRVVGLRQAKSAELAAR